MQIIGGTYVSFSDNFQRLSARSNEREECQDEEVLYNDIYPLVNTEPRSMAGVALLYSTAITSLTKLR